MCMKEETITGLNRLDLSASNKKTVKFFKHRYEREWVFGIYNAYSRLNPYFVYFGIDALTQKPTAKQVSLLSIIPSVSFNFKFWKMKRIKFLLIPLVCLLMQCKKDITIDFPPQHNSQVFIEGMLYPGEKPQIFISTSNPFFSEDVTPQQVFARDAVVKISSGGIVDVLDNFFILCSISIHLITQDLCRVNCFLKAKW
jgi:hypothetical protein